MALKAVLESLDGLPEGVAGLYVEQDGKFILDLDEEALKQHPNTGPLTRALTRERERAAEASKALKALEDKYGDLDPEAAREAIEAAREAGDKNLMDEGKIDELITQRTERMRKDFEKQIQAKDAALEETASQLTATNGKLADVTIFDAVKDAALGKGARKEALTDITNRAREIWRLENGAPLARKGDDVLYGKSGEALTIGEWVESLSSEASYLFEPNRGGSADGGDRGGEARSSGGIKLISPDSSGDFISEIASGEAQINRG
jgi:hypothetical protein